MFISPTLSKSCNILAFLQVQVFEIDDGLLQNTLKGEIVSIQGKNSIFLPNTPKIGLFTSSVSIQY